MTKYDGLSYRECFAVLKEKASAITKAHGRNPDADNLRRELADDISMLVDRLEMVAPEFK